MTSDESAEQSQRTVAELLAQYGEGTAATGRRRARRRPEDTGAQQAAGPSTTEPDGQTTNGEHAEAAPTDLFEAGVPGDAPGGGFQPPGPGTPPPPAGAVAPQQPVPQPTSPPPPHSPPPPAPPSQAPPEPPAGFPAQAWAPQREHPPAYPPGQDVAGSMDPAVESAETAPWYREEGGRTGWPPDGQRNGPAAEPPTDQLPRSAPMHANGHAAPDGQLPVGNPGPLDYGTALRPDEPGDPTAVGVPLDDLDVRDAGAFGPAADVDVPMDGEVDNAPAATRVAERADATPGSPTTAWLAMVAQWVGGAIGGAALWVAFRYLWTAMPVVALVAAVLVTGGLVLLVRAIRRSDDLKTTVFAVLVGLVVTVSPAVLVLVTR